MASFMNPLCRNCRFFHFGIITIVLSIFSSFFPDTRSKALTSGSHVLVIKKNNVSQPQKKRSYFKFCTALNRIYDQSSYIWERRKKTGPLHRSWVMKCIGFELDSFYSRQWIFSVCILLHDYDSIKSNRHNWKLFLEHNERRIEKKNLILLS